MAKSKPESETATDGLSKMEAVRRALQELGYDAKPIALQTHVKDKYGIDMETNMISSYKSTLSKKSSGESKALPRGKSGRGGGNISVDDLETIKDLADRLGADKLKRLVDLMDD